MVNSILNATYRVTEKFVRWPYVLKKNVIIIIDIENIYKLKKEKDVKGKINVSIQGIQKYI